MFDQKNKKINPQNLNMQKQEDSLDDGNLTIHTMQDDINALSGIFPKEKEVSAPSDFNKIDNSKGKPKNEQYFNPFLDKQVSPDQEKVSDFASKNNVPANVPIKKEMTSSSRLADAKDPFAKKIIWVTAIAIVIAASFLGGYYFWINKKSPIPVAENNQEVTLKPEETKTEETEPKNIESIPKYSSNKPELLPIDTENPSYENLRSVLTQTASEIKDLKITEPVEFVVTGKDRSPISFSMFKVIGNINLSDNLMKNLGDNFSLFIYHSGEKLRIGLSVDMTDQTKTLTLIKAEELKLVEELYPLFLEDVVIPKEKMVFKDNNYKGVDIRYFNLTPDQQTTIDYALTKNQLIIGMSKNTAWAVIDKVLDGIK